MAAGQWGSTISGGGAAGAAHFVTGCFGTVGGGVNNQTTNWAATVAGGQSNVASGEHATISGGRENRSTAWRTTVGGGELNEASGPVSTVGGGCGNVASGLAAAVPGGNSNLAAGNWSFAAGNKAKAVHDNTFVWNDAPDQGADFASTAANQFLIHAAGGIGINKNDPLATLDVPGQCVGKRCAHRWVLSKCSRVSWHRYRVHRSRSGLGINGVLRPTVGHRMELAT